MNMQEMLNNIKEESKIKLEGATSLKAMEELRIKFLGKKGMLTDILKNMGKLSPEEKKTLGREANLIKRDIEALINARVDMLKKAEKEARLQRETIDVTEPGVAISLGTKHPISQVIDEVLEIFQEMGYEVIEGPLVDTVFNAFDGLNSPKTHPSRDLTDTFYIGKDICLRPHTSTVEIRTLKDKPVPFKMISPGRCFRCDTPDATHSPMFHQIEGMVVDEGITMADLKGTLDMMAKRLFGPETKTKFRPHHFPFTEPSAEMDVSCFKCGGKGCNVCKGSGWIEILGCGMTHPNVHSVGDVDTEKFTGFAFGMGVERIAMLKYGIEDIRHFYENDMRFIEQFK